MGDWTKIKIYNKGIFLIKKNVMVKEGTGQRFFVAGPDSELSKTALPLTVLQSLSILLKLCYISINAAITAHNPSLVTAKIKYGLFEYILSELLDLA